MSQVCQLPEKDMAHILKTMTPLDIDVLIGKNLKRIRENKGISQVQLAAMIGTTPQRLSAYETGRDGMGKEYMERVCRALSIRPVEFYFEESTLIVADDQEQAALDRYRREQAAGVAEDVAKYGEFRIGEAKKKSEAPGEDAQPRVQRIAKRTK